MEPLTDCAWRRRDESPCPQMVGVHLGSLLGYDSVDEWLQKAIRWYSSRERSRAFAAESQAPVSRRTGCPSSSDRRPNNQLKVATGRANCCNGEEEECPPANSHQKTLVIK